MGSCLNAGWPKTGYRPPYILVYWGVLSAKLCYPRLLLCVIAAIAIIAVIAIIAKLYCWQINLILAKMLLDLFAPNPN